MTHSQFQTTCLSLAFLLLPSNPASAQPQCVLAWDSLSEGIVGGTPYEIWKTLVVDLGDGPELYVCGEITSAGGVPVNNLARWNGREWSDPGVEPNDRITSIGFWNDSAGAALYALIRPDSNQMQWHLGRFDGVHWAYTAFSARNTSQVLPLSLQAFDDGRGPALFVGGMFTHINGQPFSGIARWDGFTWSAVGGGVTDSFNAGYQCVYTFLPYGPPGQQVLICGGQFSHAGGVVTQNVAAWNGQQWSSFGSMMNHQQLLFPGVQSLALFDDGTGTQLYASGPFVGPTIRYIARWDGSLWNSVGPFMTGSSQIINVFCVRTWDDGSGPALYAGGNFESCGDEQVRGLARWNPATATWHEVAGGVGPVDDAPFGFGRYVRELVPYTDGAGEGLIAAGRFQIAGNLPLRSIARLGCVRGDLDCGGAVNNFDIDAFVLALTDPDAYAAAYPNCPLALADVNRDGAVNNLDIDVFVECLMAGVCP